MTRNNGKRRHINRDRPRQQLSRSLGRNSQILVLSLLAEQAVVENVTRIARAGVLLQGTNHGTATAGTLTAKCICARIGGLVGANAFLVVGGNGVLADENLAVRDSGQRGGACDGRQKHQAEPRWAPRAESCMALRVKFQLFGKSTVDERVHAFVLRATVRRVRTNRYNFLLSDEHPCRTLQVTTVDLVGRESAAEATVVAQTDGIMQPVESAEVLGEIDVSVRVASASARGDAFFHGRGQQIALDTIAQDVGNVDTIRFHVLNLSNARVKGVLIVVQVDGPIRLELVASGEGDLDARHAIRRSRNDR